MKSERKILELIVKDQRLSEQVRRNAQAKLDQMQDEN